MKNLSLFIFTIVLVLIVQQIHAQTITAELLQDAGTSKDWSIGGSGEDLEIREPEQGKVWARFVDDDRLELIGTPNLKVAGNIDVATDKYIRIGHDDLSNGSLLMTNAACCVGSYMDYAGGPLIFRVAGVSSSAPMTLQTDGSIVMGGDIIYDGRIINTQGHKLSVNGGILCEEVKVIQNVPSSDYVFEKDYDLLSIKELKEYVEKNKHLPEVPSAEEFKKNGYKVGDMDDLLLRKVEELTLYIIQLEEKIDRLEGGKQD